uniref:Uncharacterized protein n=1 Tax=Arundo donax TaxID=35708 RepID=A0A0A9AFB0_ARUDO
MTVDEKGKLVILLYSLLSPVHLLAHNFHFLVKVKLHFPFAY